MPAGNQKDAKVLQTILPEDIPITDEEAIAIRNNGFDEEEIKEALRELDGMVGLEKVKVAIHNFVEVARYRNKKVM